MVKISISYKGDLRCTATHTPSGSLLHTDAPVDNRGKGENFSPTDLVSTALGTCIATIMAIYAQDRNISLQGMKIEVEKEMKENPRRIGRLAVDIYIPVILEERHRKGLEMAAHHCPVHKSLHPEVEIPITFHYPQE